MIDAIVRRGTLLTVAALVLCVLGLLAAFRVPVQMIPDLEVREISVRTNWPGATPQDVEKEILIEQEEFLRAVPNLSRLIAYASTGRAEIELEFPFGTDITQALIDVNNALSQVPAYPETVDEPRVTADSFSQNSFMYYRVVPLSGNPRALDMDMMRDFIDDNVRTRMERVRGVSQVDVRGGAERHRRRVRGVVVGRDGLGSQRLSHGFLRGGLLGWSLEVMVPVGTDRFWSAARHGGSDCCWAWKSRRSGISCSAR